MAKRTEINAPSYDEPETLIVAQTYRQQTLGDYSTNVINYDYLPHARLRLRINRITV